MSKCTFISTLAINIVFLYGLIKKKVYEVREERCKNKVNTLSTQVDLDVDSTSFERYGRQMNVKITLCAYRA